MANAGRPVSRHVLVEAVWGLEAREPKTVETHIRRLRLKLEDDPASPHRIVTVRNVGYRYNGGGN